MKKKLFCVLLVVVSVFGAFGCGDKDKHDLNLSDYNEYVTYRLLYETEKSLYTLLLEYKTGIDIVLQQSGLTVNPYEITEIEYYGEITNDADSIFHVYGTVMQYNYLIQNNSIFKSSLAKEFIAPYYPESLPRNFPLLDVTPYLEHFNRTNLLNP